MRRLVISLTALTGLAASLTLGGCTPQVKSPDEPGVCYFIGHPTPKEVKFNVLATKVPDLEHCAVHLYNLRRDLQKTGTAGPETDGSYMGMFLFATNTEVRSGQRYEGPAFPFLVKAPGEERLVGFNTVVEEDNAPSGPQTVNIPKDLPQKK